MLNIYKADAGRLTIAEAKRWLLHYSPRERFADVYRREDGTLKVVDDGEPKSIFAAHLDEDFAANCARLEVVPSWKYRPGKIGYTGNPEADESYDISHDEFVKLADLFGLVVKPIADMQAFVTSARPLKVERALRLINPAEQVAFRESIGGIDGNGITTAREYIACIEEMIARQAASFFTVGEAAQILADTYPEISLRPMLAQMERACREKVLTIRSRDRFALLEGEAFGRITSLVEVSDLNAWLDATRAGYRFPKVAGAAPECFRLEDVAKSIRTAKFPRSDAFGLELLHALERAVKTRELEAYNPTLKCAWQPPPNETWIWVKAEAVNAYLSKAGHPYRFLEDLEEVPVVHAFTEPPAAAPGQDQDKGRRNWWDVAGPYMVAKLRGGKFATAKAFDAALTEEAGSPDSPFDKGTGDHRGSLIVRETSAPLALKTIQNNWSKLRETASKK